MAMRRLLGCDCLNLVTWCHTNGAAPLRGMPRHKLHRFCTEDTTSTFSKELDSRDEQRYVIFTDWNCISNLAYNPEDGVRNIGPLMFRRGSNWLKYNELLTMFPDSAFMLQICFTETPHDLVMVRLIL